ncbi:MAG: ATP-binding protein [Clostridia bacterium]|nr:ATP-binding protein [Clostridia bacterium]
MIQETERRQLGCELSALTVFRGVLNHAPMQALLAYLNGTGPAYQRMSDYGAFVASLSDDNTSFSDFLCRVIYTDENPYIVGTAQNVSLSPALRANAEAELALFSRLTHLRPEDMELPDGYQGYLPRFENTPVDFAETYAERLAHIGRYGYGVFAQAKMFRVADNDEIVPVAAADEIGLERFVGYEEERRQVFDNTQALVDGKPAANVLLFGDAGTGKSSTVKACANYFADRGVRLIELRKDQLFSLSAVMGRIAGNPLKFIIFIDDLSFNKNDDCFSMLKAALEGSASAKANNAVIYATSNRRHIVKETFADRAGADDVHHSDTVQELMSLSDRFGLTVYFQKPNKALYLDIIHRLAEKHGVEIPAAELDVKAEAFALAKGSRSPRAAEQFINSLL